MAIKLMVIKMKIHAAEFAKEIILLLSGKTLKCIKIWRETQKNRASGFIF